MKLIELLNVLKTQHYEVWIEGRVLGTISRNFITETDSDCSIIFSSQDLIDFLDLYVKEIIPVCTEPGKSKCEIILDEEL